MNIVKKQIQTRNTINKNTKKSNTPPVCHKNTKNQKKGKLSLIITLDHWQNKTQLCNRPSKLALSPALSGKTLIILPNAHCPLWYVTSCSSTISPREKIFFVFFFTLF